MYLVFQETVIPRVQGPTWQEVQRCIGMPQLAPTGGIQPRNLGEHMRVHMHTPAVKGWLLRVTLAVLERAEGFQPLVGAKHFSARLTTVVLEAS